MSDVDKLTSYAGQASCAIRGDRREAHIESLRIVACSSHLRLFRATAGGTARGGRATSPSSSKNCLFLFKVGGVELTAPG